MSIVKKLDIELNKLIQDALKLTVVTVLNTNDRVPAKCSHIFLATIANYD